MSNRLPRILVSLATYNERDNLGPLLKEILHQVPEADVLVIDDNSPDGTGALADSLQAVDPRIHVLHRPGKLGLGTAILTGMHYALSHDFDCMVNMDADFSHHPRYLPALLAGMKDHDLMIGSRYVPGGGTRNWPWSRQLMSKSVSMLARFLMRLPAHDTSGGYRCYAVPLLRRTPLERIVSLGYSFQEEVLYRCRLAGCRVGETPIIFEDRRAGASKVNLKEAVRSLWLILFLGLRVFWMGSVIFSKINQKQNSCPVFFNLLETAMKQPNLLNYTSLTTPIGTFLVVASANGLCALRLIEVRSVPELLEEIGQAHPGATLVEDAKALRPLARKIEAVIAGRLDAATIPLDVPGTSFQKRVWQVVMRVPWGKTYSYSELARKVGKPNAVRAVASACARNPVAFVVPCHRILRKSGSLGGYYWGLEMKQQLLDREKS